MKKIFLAILALVTLVAFVYIFRPIESKNAPVIQNLENPQTVLRMPPSACRIIALGDSLTAGYNLDISASYPSQLEGLLQKNGKNCQVINAGVSGDTSKMLLERLDFALGEQSYTLAILAIGANDGLQGLPVASMEANIVFIIEKLRSRNIPILLTGIQIPNNAGSYAKEFREVYPRLAETYKIPLYPFFLEGVALDPTYNLSDGIHPNSAGYAMIATKIFEYLTKTSSISL